LLRASIFSRVCEKTKNAGILEQKVGLLGFIVFFCTICARKILSPVPPSEK
jgi:hypothetical protein